MPLDINAVGPHIGPAISTPDHSATSQAADTTGTLSFPPCRQEAGLTASISWLPSELVDHIISFLPVRDANAFAQTATAFQLYAATTLCPSRARLVHSANEAGNLLDQTRHAPPALRHGVIVALAGTARRLPEQERATAVAACVIAFDTCPPEIAKQLWSDFDTELLSPRSVARITPRISNRTQADLLVGLIGRSAPENCLPLLDAMAGAVPSVPPKHRTYVGKAAAAALKRYADRLPPDSARELATSLHDMVNDALMEQARQAYAKLWPA